MFNIDTRTTVTFIITEQTAELHEPLDLRTDLDRPLTLLAPEWPHATRIAIQARPVVIGRISVAKLTEERAIIVSPERSNDSLNDDVNSTPPLLYRDPAVPIILEAQRGFFVH